MDSSKNDKLVAVLSIAFLYLIFDFIGVGCPIHFFTGISCPGCGMTRAWKSLLKGNINKALYYHPLVFLPLLGLVILIFRNRIKRSYLNVIICIISLLFIVVYIVRLIYIDNGVVDFNLEKGIIYQGIKRIIELVK